MKRYIKATAEKEFNITTMYIDIEYYFVDNEDDLSISASVDYPSNKNVEYDVVGTVLDDYDSLIATVSNLLEMYGFVLIEEKPSNKSNSVYIKFCYEDEYIIQEVDVIFSMRISDHNVPKQRKHSSLKEAQNHMRRKHQEHVDKNYQWLNKRFDELDNLSQTGELKLPDNELHIPLVMSFVKLNKQQMHNQTELRKRITSELIRLKHGNPSSKQ